MVVLAALVTALVFVIGPVFAAIVAVLAAVAFTGDLGSGDCDIFNRI